MSRLLALLLMALVTVGASHLDDRRPQQAPPSACLAARPSAGYAKRVERALRAKEDVWGNDLLGSPEGPTLAGARRYLSPLFLAKAAQGAALTDSGVHYLPFSGQVRPSGAGSMALHVADGSQILSQRASGRGLTVGVGSGGRERYGSCLERLGAPALDAGYLPILQTRSADAQGVRYRQESFAVRIPETRALASFMQLTADARAARSRKSAVRFTASELGLRREGERLVRGDATYLVFSPGGAVEGSSVTYDLPAGRTRTVYVAWLNAPDPSERIALDRDSYARAREVVAQCWTRRLAEGMTIDVPERRVANAERGLLIQNLAPPGDTASATPTNSSRSPKASTSPRC